MSSRRGPTEVPRRVETQRGAPGRRHRGQRRPRVLTQMACIRRERGGKRGHEASETMSRAAQMLTRGAREELERARRHYETPAYTVYVMMDTKTLLKYVGMTGHAPVERYRRHFDGWTSALLSRRAKGSGWTSVRMFTVGRTRTKATALEAEAFFIRKLRTEGEGLNQECGAVPRLHTDFELDVREVDVGAVHGWLAAKAKRGLMAGLEYLREVGWPTTHSVDFEEGPEPERALTEEEEREVMAKLPATVFHPRGLWTMVDMLEETEGMSRTAAFRMALSYAYDDPKGGWPREDSAYGLCHYSLLPEGAEVAARLHRIMQEAAEELEGTEKYGKVVEAYAELWRALEEEGGGDASAEGARREGKLSERAEALAGLLAAGGVGQKAAMRFGGALETAGL